MAHATHVLTFIPEVLERILDYLPAINLIHMQRVCKSWQTSALRVLEKREREFSADFFTIVQHENLTEFEREKDTKNGNPQGELSGEMSSWRSQWRRKPALVICVCRFNEPSSSNAEKKKLRSELDEVLRCWFPPACKLLALNTIDSVVCGLKNNCSAELNPEDYRSIYNFASLPLRHNNFEINIINLEKKTKQAKQNFRELVEKELKDPDLKMVFILQKLPEGRWNERSWLLDESAKVAQKNVVVAGCLFNFPIMLYPGFETKNDEEACQSSEKSKPQENVVVTFKGKNVLAASVLIDNDVDTPDELNRGLTKLKTAVKKFNKKCPSMCENRTISGQCYDCQSQMLGFMIGCCSRANTRVWYNGESEDNEQLDIAPNIEQASFRNMIPNVPLIGTYGMGEIGGSFNLSLDNARSDFSIAQDDLLNSECTIFAVVMLK